MLNFFILILYILVINFIILSMVHLITKITVLIHKYKKKSLPLKLYGSAINPTKALIITGKLVCSFLTLAMLTYVTTSPYMTLVFNTKYWLYGLIVLFFFSYDGEEKKDYYLRTLVLMSLASIIVKSGQANLVNFTFNQVNLASKSFLNAYFIKDPMGFLCLSMAIIHCLKQYFQNRKVTNLVYLSSLFSLYIIIYLGGNMPPSYLSKLIDSSTISFSILSIFSLLLKYIATIVLMSLVALSQKKEANQVDSSLK